MPTSLHRNVVWSRERLDLKHAFGQVWVISLKRRADRLEEFWRELAKAKWPFAPPKVFEAIDGNLLGTPAFWQTGAGSYGCLRSHLTILERAIMDNVPSLLVLEDDAVFDASFREGIGRFLANVPRDWHCLMLGGQHINSQPIPVSPGVVRAGGGGGIQRTHCYALRGRDVMKDLYHTWANAAVHCDWVMGPCMAKWNTYAPDPFLVGQSDGRSDISGAVNPSKFWRSPDGTEPVVVLHAPREVMEALRAKGFHSGYTRDPATGIDVGLRDLFADKMFSNKAHTESDRARRLRNWIRTIQWEAASMAERAICTVWHPDARAETIRPLVRGKVVTIRASTVEEALRQLPPDIHTPPPQIIRVVLLRSSREVMEALRGRGWHGGYWRDDATGQDNGVRRLLAGTSHPQARAAGLRKIVEVLHDEARQIPGGMPTLWHEEITAEMIQDSDIEVVEIRADCAEDAITQLENRTDERGS